MKEKLIFREIRDILDNGRILDVGCGTGRLIEVLSKELKQSSFFGIDISDRSLDIARGRGIENAQFIKSNSTKKIFENNFFDFVFIIDVIHDIRKDMGNAAVEKTIKNAYSYLKNDGKLIIRDGFRPPQTKIKIKLIDENAYELFQSFQEKFSKKIHYIEYEDTILIDLKDLISFLSKIQKLKKIPEIEELKETKHYSLEEYESMLTKSGFTQSKIVKYKFPKNSIPEDIKILDDLPETYCMLVYIKKNKLHYNKTES